MKLLLLVSILYCCMMCAYVYIVGYFLCYMLCCMCIFYDCVVLLYCILCISHTLLCPTLLCMTASILISYYYICPVYTCSIHTSTSPIIILIPLPPPFTHLRSDCERRSRWQENIWRLQRIFLVILLFKISYYRSSTTHIRWYRICCCYYSQ